MSSCFVTENLMSDYIEGLLPQIKSEQIEEHLKDCTSCRQLKEKFPALLFSLRNSPQKPMPAPLLSQAFEAVLSEKLPSKFWFFSLSIVAIVIVGFTSYFASFLQKNKPEHFERYYPLYEGAHEVIEDHVSLLQMGDALSKNIWEEGGLSAEDFEKTFRLEKQNE